MTRRSKSFSDLEQSPFKNAVAAIATSPTSPKGVSPRRPPSRSLREFGPSEKARMLDPSSAEHRSSESLTSSARKSPSGRESAKNIVKVRSPRLAHTQDRARRSLKEDFLKRPDSFPLSPDLTSADVKQEQYMPELEMLTLSPCRKYQSESMAATERGRAGVGAEPNTIDIRGGSTGSLELKKSGIVAAPSESVLASPRSAVQTFRKQLLMQEWIPLCSDRSIQAATESVTGHLRLALTVQQSYDCTKEAYDLFVACRKGRVEEVTFLLKTTALHAHSLNHIRDSTLRTPLFYACESGNLELIKYLIKIGANPNSRDQWGRTPLSYCENEELRQLLLASGAAALLKYRLPNDV